MNRFGYVQNNPIRFIDPTGHMICAFCNGEGGKLTPLQKAIDAQKLAVLEREGERRRNNKKSEEPSEPFDGLNHCALEAIDSNQCYQDYKLNLYYEIGYPDIGDLAAERPFKNPLGEHYDMDYFNPEFISNQNPQNVKFLEVLSVDQTFLPNYESLYLDALKIENSRTYDDVIELIEENKPADWIDASINILTE